MAPTLPSSSSPFPDMRVSGVSFPDSPITIAAFAYAKDHTTEAVYNHSVRSAYWALILAKKLDFPPLLLKTAAQAGNNKNNKNGKKENVTVQADGGTRELDPEVVVLACILHDMGWATNKELLSTYKRFEVDGADLARGFLERYVKDGGQGAEDWGLERVQRVWYAIACKSSFPFLFFPIPFSPPVSLSLSLFPVFPHTSYLLDLTIVVDFGKFSRK